MDRYVIRESRSGEYPGGNQMIAFSATTSISGNNNITIPENAYYGGYEGEIRTANIHQLEPQSLVPQNVQAYSTNVVQAQGQIVSGIDQSYLAAYGNNNPAYYAHSMQKNAVHSFGSDYQNRNFVGAIKPKLNNAQMENDHFHRVRLYNQNFSGNEASNYNLNRGKGNTTFVGAQSNQIFNKNGANNQNFTEAQSHEFNSAQVNNNPNRADVNYDQNFTGTKTNNHNFNRGQENNHNFNRGQENNHNFNRGQENNHKFNRGQENNQNFKSGEMSGIRQYTRRYNKFETNFIQEYPPVSSTKQTETDLLKHELQNPVKIRAEKLKELQKSGSRVFSGPVEKILKWHKSLQDIGVMVLYEIVGKCVSVRAGERRAKNLVVRDENGPAIQVVYYEIDFFLPQLTPNCTVRVIGRMMPGTNRFQAFDVRPATGDDLATLPRRAAVSSHHVAKLCKEYGVEVLMLK